MTEPETRIDGSILCFAYGSNMSSRYLRQYCPNAKPGMCAALPNFRIEFRRYSDDLGGGISTIMPAPGALIRFGDVQCVFEPTDDTIDAPKGSSTQMISALRPQDLLGDGGGGQ